MNIINQRRQGEILFIEVAEWPDDTEHRTEQPEGNQLIVGHSETGHHHVIDIERSPNAQLLIDQTNELMGRLSVGEEGATVEHLRSFDTHKSLELPPNSKHIVRWRREYTPDGLRRVED